MILIGRSKMAWRNSSYEASGSGKIAVIIVLALLGYPAMADETSRLAEGKALAFDRKKGNCPVCHAMGTGESLGRLGPPLIAMRERYADKSKLRAQIWDASKRNLTTSMPPFGRHRILTEDEIDKVTEYIYSL